MVCDRYVYDAAAEMESSLPAINWLHRLAINLMLAIAPKPDIAYFLDVPEGVSNLRKETKTNIYYLSRLRAIYFRLSDRYGVRVKNNYRDFNDIAGEIAREVSILYHIEHPALANRQPIPNSGQLTHHLEKEKV